MVNQRKRKTHTHTKLPNVIHIIYSYFILFYKLFCVAKNNATHLIFWPLLTSRASRLMESAQKNSARLRLESPRAEFETSEGQWPASVGVSLKLHDPTMDQWISWNSGDYFLNFVGKSSCCHFPHDVLGSCKAFLGNLCMFNQLHKGPFWNENSTQAINLFSPEGRQTVSRLPLSAASNSMFNG